MISHEVSFDDEVSGQGVSVFVKASNAHYFDKSKKDSNGLYRRLHPTQTGQEDHQGNEGGAQ